MSVPKHIVSAAAIVLNDKNELLLVKNPRRGWEMPGGQVEEGESIKTAAIRETEEESGIIIEVTKFCGIFQNVEKSICNTLFLGKPIGGECRTSIESEEVGYFPLEQALDMVKWKNFRQRIELCLANQEEPFFIPF
ncbi:NUDIX hydrolase [Alkalicoccobacillus plakortidis]|uniref:NUDIX hydrolase n=1 Tax=Alkalicoccobacillus plakortidis TaxID=444060 RepID=A0ABT0XQ11_9BACI|nr:NUDIX hydrolase [Alkalicoccobacillus plakortidis]MCM2677961.1 NUDIX hydrolase [Alkalicoccobacillus plakortidis]